MFMVDFWGVFQRYFASLHPHQHRGLFRLAPPHWYFALQRLNSTVSCILSEVVEGRSLQVHHGQKPNLQLPDFNLQTRKLILFPIYNSERQSRDKYHKYSPLLPHLCGCFRVVTQLPSSTEYDLLIFRQGHAFYLCTWLPSLLHSFWNSSRNSPLSLKASDFPLLMDPWVNIQSKLLCILSEHNKTKSKIKSTSTLGLKFLYQSFPIFSVLPLSRLFQRQPYSFSPNLSVLPWTNTHHTFI